MEIPQEKSPWMEVALHTLRKLTPKAYGTEVERFKADIPAVSTWRPKGSTAKHHDSITEGMPEEVVGNIAKFAAANADAQAKGKGSEAQAPTSAAKIKGPTSTMSGLPLP